MGKVSMKGVIDMHVHISPSALPAYLPLLPGFFIIWYLLGHAL